MKQFNRWIAVFVLITAIGIGWYWARNTQKPVPQFETVRAQRHTLLDTIEAPGTVTPRNRVEITPTIGGRIESIQVKEGDYVQAGSILAVMSSTDRAALLDVARSETPTNSTYWESIYPPTRLFSPLNGQVIARNIEPGQSVNTNTVVFVIADSLIVIAQVDETDIGKVRVGMNTHISLDAFSDQSVKGTVEHIAYESKVVNNVSVYDVEIRLNHVPPHFRSGMTATAQFIRSQHENTLVVPDRAIQYGKQGAYLISKSSPAPPQSDADQHRINIKPGISGNGFTEITHPTIQAGDEFWVMLRAREQSKRSKGLVNFRPRSDRGNSGYPRR